ncbi:MAG TPA: class I SAM-dependent methyltransferase, partial [Pyrinomonadaceae bacterium]
MSEEHSQHRDTALAEWRESAAHWGKHARTIRTMFTPITDALIQEASIRRGAKVLDVAAGPGEPSLSIAEFVGAEGCVVSSDAIGGMVAAGFKEAQRRHVKNISFAQCEAGALPFADSSFDSVVSRLGAMFFPDIGEALREMCRVNRPGGSISL